MSEESALGEAAVQFAAKGGWNGATKPRKKLTNAYLVQGSRVLLGLKKRGFGEGKVNGFGGKVDSSETVRDAAFREMKEESGVALLDMTLVGVLLYDYPLKESTMEVYVYRATKFDGEVVETEEMLPKFVEREHLDYDRMWADDPWWLDKLFSMDFEKEAFIGWFNFTEDMTKVVKCEVKDINRQELFVQ